MIDQKLKSKHSNQMMEFHHNMDCNILSIEVLYEGSFGEKEDNLEGNNQNN